MGVCDPALETELRELVGAGHRHLERAGSIDLEEGYLVLGKPSQLPQLGSDHMADALLLRRPARSLPDAHHWRALGWNVALH